MVPFDAMELAFRYDIVCFNTAIKPWVFKLLFARGYERARRDVSSDVAPGRAGACSLYHARACAVPMSER